MRNLFLILLFALAACNNESNTETSETNKTSESVDSLRVHRDSATHLPTDSSGQIIYSYVDLDSGITKITLPEMTITIDSFIYNKGTTQGRQVDSMFIVMEPGEMIEGKKIMITSNITGLSVEQQYETSITISNEGPHCDLKNWKHYYSGWTALNRSGQNSFVVDDYNMNERKKFISINIDELKEKVRVQCGEFWKTLIRNIKTPNDHPASVAISRYFLKITGVQQGKPVSRILVFESPMGD